MNERSAEFEPLTDQDRKGIEQILTDMLSAYDKERDAKEVKQFCVDYAQQLNTYDDANAALSDVTCICDTIDCIDEEYHALREAGKRGTSRADWLRRVLQEHLRPEQGKTRNQCVTELQRSVADATTHLLRKLTKQDIPIAPQLKEYSLDNPVDAQVTATHFADNVQHVAELSSMLFSEQFTQNGEGRHPAIDVVKDFFESDLDSDNRNFKKVAASATVLAQKTGVLRTPKNMGTHEVAAAVDLGASTVKAAYKVATGERSALEGMEHVYDRATAATSEIIKHHASSIGGAIGMSIGAAVGTLFSAAGTIIGGQIGVMVGSMAGEKVGDFLSVGVKQLAEQAKTFAKTAWTGTTSIIGGLITRNA